MIGIKVVDSQNDIELSHNDFSGVYKFVDKKLSFEKKLDGNKFLVIIELNDNFHYMCRIVRKLRRLFENKEVSFCLISGSVPNSSGSVPIIRVLANVRSFRLSA